jgi:chromosomal replication initiator protein
MIFVADIKRAVADLYGLPIEVMRSPRRDQPMSRPRQVAMFCSRRLTHFSTTVIGQQFDRDHSTVIHGCQQIEKLMQTDSEERRAVGEIGLRFIEAAI